MNDFRAVVDRWMRLSRMQVVHLVAGALEPVTAERRSDRAADRGALRRAERAVLRLVEAQLGTEASRRQSASAKFRIILYDSVGGLCHRQ